MIYADRVRPLAGARIETSWLHTFNQDDQFAPSRGRGLKHHPAMQDGWSAGVRPLAGARIETTRT